MLPDELITEFEALAASDPDMRIGRSVFGDAETVDLVPGGRHPDSTRRFRAIATEAVAWIGLDDEGDAVERWLRFVFEHAPELVCDNRPPGSVQAAVLAGTVLIAESIPNAASASALVVRRRRDRLPLVVADLADSSDAPASSVAVSDDALLTSTKLAETFGVPADALRSRLNRWRKTHHNGWIENTERGPRDAKYLYCVGAVRTVIDDLKAASEATSERPAKNSAG